MRSLSFEVFPPASVEGLDALRGTSRALAGADPAYFSVTYGAGGSNRDRSFSAIDAVRPAGVPVTAHLTCVGQSRDDVGSVLDRYEDLGIKRVVALRGDPPEGVDAPYSAHPDGFQRTADLVALAAQRGFRVAVSAYPERHPQSPTIEHDIDVLAAKVDAGADEAITQMCFDDDAVIRLRDRLAARGIEVDLVPGIFPIHSFTAVERFAGRCGATLPVSVRRRFERVAGRPDAEHDTAATFAAEQISRLRAAGIERFHLYTLNRAELSLEVCDRAGVLPAAAV